MPTYTYRCRTCRLESDLVSLVEHRDLARRCLCGGRLVRVFRPGHLFFRRSWDTHFNASVGRVVTNDREFRDSLKRGSEEMSVRLGYDHSFVPVTDPAQVGIDPDRASDEAARTRSLRSRPTLPRPTPAAGTQGAGGTGGRSPHG